MFISLTNVQHFNQEKNSVLFKSSPSISPFIIDLYDLRDLKNIMMGNFSKMSFVFFQNPTSISQSQLAGISERINNFIICEL